MKDCIGYSGGGIPPHPAMVSDFNVGKNRCKSCTANYYADWRAKAKAKAFAGVPAQPRRARRASPPKKVEPQAAPKVLIEEVERLTEIDPVTNNTHRYIPQEGLERWFKLFESDSSHPAPNLIMHGPAGSGKGNAAAWIAQRLGVPLFKVDASSMVDAESWFGTREIVNGATVYEPSQFVVGIEQPSVVFVDEYNRVGDHVRNVWLPLMDDTRSVLNPLTGQMLNRHPQCWFIMAGNVGTEFTGTTSVDPAYRTRAYVKRVGYVDAPTEIRILREAWGVSHEHADTLVRFATATREHNATGDAAEIDPVSTRELLAAARLISLGASVEFAVTDSILEGVSDGKDGPGSPRAILNQLWSMVYTKPAEEGDKVKASDTPETVTPW